MKNHVIELWNSYADQSGKSKILKICDERERHFLARVKAEKERSDIEWWNGFIEFISGQSFLREEKFFDFDWMIKNESHLTKIIEGKYA